VECRQEGLGNLVVRKTGVLLRRLGGAGHAVVLFSTMKACWHMAQRHTHDSCVLGWLERVQKLQHVLGRI
jgi:hypothetical protein